MFRRRESKPMRFGIARIPPILTSLFLLSKPVDNRMKMLKNQAFITYNGEVFPQPQYIVDCLKFTYKCCITSSKYDLVFFQAFLDAAFFLLLLYQ